MSYQIDSKLAKGRTNKLNLLWCYVYTPLHLEKYNFMLTYSVIHSTTSLASYLVLDKSHRHFLLFYNVTHYPVK